MTQRERNVATIVGSFAGVAVLYWLVNAIYLTPIANARIDHANKLNRLAEIEKLEQSEGALARTWNDIVARTLSFESNKVRDWFSEDLKNLVQRHGFEASTFRPAGGTRISIDRKHPVVMQGCRISVTGEYTRVVDLVNDIYKTPYTCKITELTITPMGPRVGRDIVKADMTVETPVMPRIEPSISKFAAVAAPMDHDAMAALPPARRDVLAEEAFAVLDERNILREYMPPPNTTVTVNNEDWKTIAVQVDFYWEGEILEQYVETVPGNSQKPVAGRGDVVEVRGSYADGEAFGPRKFTFGANRTEMYKVALHTPPPDPEYIMLAVTNQDAKDILVDVTVTSDKGKTIRHPPMVIAAGQTLDVGEWQASQVQVAARYQNGATAASQTYAASPSKHTLVVRSEPAVIEPTGPVDVSDPPPDASLTVSGLLTYHHTHEMVVTNGTERKVIKSGEPGTVDGGMLVAVHPVLGGVVQMPGTGNYYIYPLGQSFGSRYLLDAREEEELANAIDQWTRR